MYLLSSLCLGVNMIKGLFITLDLIIICITVVLCMRIYFSSIKELEFKNEDIEEYVKRIKKDK